MSSSSSFSDMTDVVINVGYGGFRLTDEMVQLLRVDDPFPSMDTLPRHDKRLVELVNAGHGTVIHNGKKTGLVVKTITGDTYRICEYDGYEWIETPSSIEWISVKKE